MFNIFKKYFCCYGVKIIPKIDAILDALEMDVTIDETRNSRHRFCVNENSVHYGNSNSDDKDRDDEL